MTGQDFFYLTPFLIIAAAPNIIMLILTIIRNIRIVYGFTLLSFISAFVSLYFLMPAVPHAIEPLFIIDTYSILFLGIILFASILITILSYIYLRHQEGEKEEFFIILLVSALGAMILVAANHFVTLFLGIETLSISLYILVAYLRTRDYCVEAGVKYLVMASVSSAFLVFGMSLVYTATGTMNFNNIAMALGTPILLSPILLAGLGMMLVGLGFKLALVPFHMWTPDVYQGAPAPVTGYIATVSKVAVLAVILRFFMNIRAFDNQALILVISLIAVLSMFTGNLLALRQNNLKRLLAYSSIAHLGYLSITLLIGTTSGLQAAIFYLVAYMLTTLGAFGVISILSSGAARDAENIADYTGLFWKKPWIAIVLTLSMLSLAGIPLTAGFIAKFYLVFAGAKSGLWILVISLIINSVISLYYYLRIVTTMFSPSDEVKLPAVSIIGNLVLAVIVIGILLLGILPGWLIDMVSNLAVIR